MALNGLFCADVPLRNYSLTHSRLCDYSIDKNKQKCWTQASLHI